MNTRRRRYFVTDLKCAATEPRTSAELLYWEFSCEVRGAMGPVRN